MSGNRLCTGPVWELPDLEEINKRRAVVSTTTTLVANTQHLAPPFNIGMWAALNDGRS